MWYVVNEQGSSVVSLKSIEMKNAVLSVYRRETKSEAKLVIAPPLDLEQFQSKKELPSRM